MSFISMCDGAAAICTPWDVCLCTKSPKSQSADAPPALLALPPTPRAAAGVGCVASSAHACAANLRLVRQDASGGKKGAEHAPGAVPVDATLEQLVAVERHSAQLALGLEREKVQIGTARCMCLAGLPAAACVISLQVCCHLGETSVSVRGPKRLVSIDFLAASYPSQGICFRAQASATLRAVITQLSGERSLEGVCIPLPKPQ